jgi:DNA polymerase V
METKHTTGMSIHAGFPNAADDTRLKKLSLDTLLVPQPNSTFYFRIAGNQWHREGIFDGDIALVDRACRAQRNDLVIWWHDDEFAISPLYRLPPGAQTWGVVTTTIHQFGDRNRK